MSTTCVCDYNLGNSGVPGCVPIAKAQKKIIVVNYYDSTGAINYIDLTATHNAAYFSAKINHADTSKRWYVLPDLKNVTDEKGESSFEEFDDNTKAFIREGVRNFAGMIIKGSYNLLGALKGYKCAEIGVFIIDGDNNIIGSISSDGTKLNPIMLESSTWDARLVKSTDSTIQKILLGFQFHSDELDENLRMLLFTDLTGVTPLTFNGLLTVNSTNTYIGLTSFSVKLFVENGSAKTKFPVKGLVAGDFVLYNVTDSLAVAIISSTESPDGTYTLTFLAQTAAEVLRLTPTKTGYDFTEVVANTHTLTA